MSMSAINPESETQSAPVPLPELHGGMMNREELQTMFADYRGCVEITEIIPKFAAQEHVPEVSSWTLDHAEEWLLGRKVRAVQVRYRYDGGEWWDTIMILPEGYRLVRIRHDW